MEVPDNLLCLYNAELEEQDDSYVIEVPAREVSTNQIASGEVCRAAVLQRETRDTNNHSTESDRQNTAQSAPEPPVEEGERRTVTIEDVGDQGDGIARVERGYVIIVPDTKLGDQVVIEIENVRQNVAFADVVGQE
ncbi:TRAM domain-containing protein [Natronorubrum aibiense]|uniref:TRAM domain-containing protein n=1 Tax=Natronorubrum aibiense TaxID=348826 RepID=A0A5P9P8J1_9EURY|nr:TRAM domain-containing protein [Natronorubrum aibiense]QFU84444.1 TRAM domain-containing protein [Natronorubrum aibiense]